MYDSSVRSFANSVRCRPSRSRTSLSDRSDERTSLNPRRNTTPSDGEAQQMCSGVRLQPLPPLSPPSLLIPASREGGLLDLPLRASNETIPRARVPRAGGRPGFPSIQACSISLPKGRARGSSTARVERPQLHSGGSASTEDPRACPVTPTPAHTPSPFLFLQTIDTGPARSPT